MKKLLSFILCLAMLLSFAVLATSCGGTPETPETPDDGETPGNDEGNGGQEVNKITYTAKFVDEDGAAIKGLVVRFVRDDVASENITTDNKGEAKLELEESRDIRVELVSFDGWVEPSARKLTFGRAYEITVELEEDTSFTLSATVVDQNGDAIVGASIQLCVGSVCLTAATTNDDGELTGTFSTPGKIKVKVVNLPDGYIMPPVLDDDGYHFYFDEDMTDIEIEIAVASDDITIND